MNDSVHQIFLFLSFDRFCMDQGIWLKALKCFQCSQSQYILILDSDSRIFDKSIWYLVTHVIVQPAFVPWVILALYKWPWTAAVLIAPYLHMTSQLATLLGHKSHKRYEFLSVACILISYSQNSRCSRTIQKWLEIYLTNQATF